MEFKTIEEFKKSAEFFPEGKIVPRRILKVKRRHSSGLKFGCPSWAILTEKGWVIAADDRITKYFLIVSNVKNDTAFGSPYIPGGYTNWIESNGVSDDYWLCNLNKALKIG